MKELSFKEALNLRNKENLRVKNLTSEELDRLKNNQRQLRETTSTATKFFTELALSRGGYMNSGGDYKQTQQDRRDEHDGEDEYLENKRHQKAQDSRDESKGTTTYDDDRDKIKAQDSRDESKGASGKKFSGYTEQQREQYNRDNKAEAKSNSRDESKGMEQHDRDKSKEDVTASRDESKGMEQHDRDEKKLSSSGVDVQGLTEAIATIITKYLK